MSDMQVLEYNPEQNGEKELAQVVQDFHIAFYVAGVWKGLTYLGVPVLKNPLDLWLYQEIVSETKPDIIVETGTYEGGSALYLAGVLDALGHGLVISIDKAPRGTPEHPRIKYIIGDSTSMGVVETVQKEAGRGEVKCPDIMVILDSDHRRSHVLKELRLYGPLVTPGQYLIIEDTNLNGHPIPFRATEEESEGPFEAVRAWLPDHPEFAQDYNCGKFGMTFNPGGYLKRK